MASSHALLSLPTSATETINTIKEIRKAIAHITGTEIYNKPTKIFSRATKIDRAYEAAPVLYKLHKDRIVVVNWLIRHETYSVIEFLEFAQKELFELLKRQLELQELEKSMIESIVATVTHPVVTVTLDSPLIFRGKDFYEFQQFYKYRVTRDGLKFIPYPENIDPNRNKPNVTLDQIDEALALLNKPQQQKDPYQHPLPLLPPDKLHSTPKELDKKFDGFTSKNKALTLLIYFSLMIFVTSKKNFEIFSRIGINTNLSTFEEDVSWTVVFATMFIMLGRAFYKDHEARKADKLKQAEREPETEEAKKMAELIKAEQAKVKKAEDVTNEDYIDRILFLIDPELRNELITIDQRREFLEVLILDSIREIDSVMDGEYRISGKRIKTTAEIELLAKRKAKQEAEEAHKKAEAEVTECLAQIITTLEAQQPLISQRTGAQEEKSQLPKPIAEDKNQGKEKQQSTREEPKDKSPESPHRKLSLLAKSRGGIVCATEPDSDDEWSEILTPKRV